MGRKATGIDIQNEVRRRLAAAPKRARPEPTPQRPKALAKLEPSQAILAADSDNYGPCFICRDARRGYWASTRHIEKAYRFPTIAEAAAACERVNSTWQGEHRYEPVVATIKVAFRRPNEAEEEVLRRAAG